MQNENKCNKDGIDAYTICDTCILHTMLIKKKMNHQQDSAFFISEEAAWNLSQQQQEAMDRAIHAWHGSVRPRVDELLSLGNQTVEIAREIVYRTIPSYASMVLVFATGWVIAIALSLCVSCWICSSFTSSRRRRDSSTYAIMHRPVVGDDGGQEMIIPSAAAAAAAAGHHHHHPTTSSSTRGFAAPSAPHLPPLDTYHYGMEGGVGGINSSSSSSSSIWRNQSSFYPSL